MKSHSRPTQCHPNIKFAEKCKTNVRPRKLLPEPASMKHYFYTFSVYSTVRLCSFIIKLQRPNSLGSETAEMKHTFLQFEEWIFSLRWSFSSFRNTPEPLWLMFLKTTVKSWENRSTKTTYWRDLQQELCNFPARKDVPFMFISPFWLGFPPPTRIEPKHSGQQHPQEVHTLQEVAWIDSGFNL